MTLKILVVGQGLIGRSLSNLSLAEFRFDFTQRVDASSRNYLDLSLPLETSNINFSDFDQMIIAAGIMGEEACRNQPELSFKINVTNTIELISHAVKFEIEIGFISSTYVSIFQNSSLLDRKHFPYTYQKSIVEHYIQQLSVPFLILRPGRVIHKKLRFLHDLETNLLKNTLVEVFDDNYFSPISLNKLKLVTSKLLDQHFTGIFNLVGQKPITNFELASAWCVARGLNSELLIPRKSYQSQRDLNTSHSLALEDLRTIGDLPESFEDLIQTIL